MKSLKNVIRKNYKLLLCFIFIIGLLSALLLRLNKPEAADQTLHLASTAAAVVERNDTGQYSLAASSTVTIDGRYMFILFRSGSTGRGVLNVYRKGGTNSYVKHQEYRDLEIGNGTGLACARIDGDYYIYVATNSDSYPSIIRYRLSLDESDTVLGPAGKRNYNVGFKVNGVAWNNRKNEMIVTNKGSAIYAFDMNFTESRIIRKVNGPGAQRTGGVLGYNYNNRDIYYFNGKIYSLTDINSSSVCHEYVEGFGLNSSVCSEGGSYFSNEETYMNYIAAFDENTGDFTKLYSIRGNTIASYASSRDYDYRGPIRSVRGVLVFDDKMYIMAQEAGNAIIALVENSGIFNYERLYVTYHMAGGTLDPTHGSNINVSGDTVVISGSPNKLLGYTGEIISGNTLDRFNNPSGINIKKDGYHVDGNNAWRDSTGKVFSQATQYKVSDIADVTLTTKTVDLYVNWIANRYIVGYAPNASGVSGTMPSQQLIYDTNASLHVNSFQRPGYTFSRWNTKADGSGATYANNVTVRNLTTVNNGTVTLYAQWQPINYILKLNNNDTTNTYKTYNLQYGVTFPLSTYKPTREGYTHQGWSRNANDTTATYSPTAGVSNLTTTNGDTVNLYAIWKPKSYTLYFNPNGGSVSVTSIGRNYDQQFGDLPTPNKTGYVFDGWYTSASGGTKVTAETICKGAATFYAHWTPIKYTVKLFKNDGTSDVNSLTVNYDETLNLANYKPTRTGYDLLGWATGPNASTATYTVDAQLKNLTDTDGTTINLYAKWDAKDCVLTFNPTGGTGGGQKTVKYGEAVGDLPASNKEGYLLAGWYTSANGGTKLTEETVIKGSATYYAQWTPISYTIAYDANGGVGSIESKSMTYGQSTNLSANSFTRSNFIFESWNTKPDGTGTNYAENQSVKNLTTINGGTVTLYAKWSEIHTYTISYDLAGGGIEGSNPVSYDSVSSSITLHNPTKEGYTFIGWTGSNGDTPSTNVTIPAGTTGNLSYTANFRVNKYKVIFITEEETKTYELDYGSEVTEIPNVSKKGYTFVGWFDEDGVALRDHVPAFDKSYSADFRPNRYNVTFDANGGTGTMEGQVITYDKKTSLFKNLFVKSSYYFGGWNTKKDGSGKTYIDEEEVLNLLSEDDEGMVLYAIWTANQNDSGGGNNTNDDNTSSDSKNEESGKKAVKNPKTGAKLNIILILLAIVIGFFVKKYAIKHKRFNRI